MNIKKGFMIVVLFILSVTFVSGLVTENIDVTSITDKSAVVSIQADETSTAIVRYWPEGGSVKQVRSSSSNKKHEITLGGLATNTKYYYNLTLYGEGDNIFNNNNVGQQFTFTTASEDNFAPFIDINLPDSYDRKQISILGKTEQNSHITLRVNNEVIGEMDDDVGEFYFHHVVLNENSQNDIYIEIEDNRGNKETYSKTIFVDTIPPNLNVTTSPEGDLINKSQITIIGNVSESSQIIVTINGEEKINTSGRSFESSVQLIDGRNYISVKAVDNAGWSTKYERTIIADFKDPEITEIRPKLDDMFFYEGSGYRSVSGKTEPNSKVYIYVDPILTPRPSDATIVGDYSYHTTTDENGNFNFDIVDLQHGKDIGRRFTIQETDDDLSITRNKKIDVYVTVEDKVGHKTTKKYTLSVGNCNEGSFVFAVNNLVDYQSPKYFSLERMKQGTEVFSFVLDLEYNGAAQNNKLKPSVEEIKDNYYQIRSVSLDSACKAGAYGESNSYTWACEVLPSRPKIAMPLNAEKTRWFFSYDLKKLSYEDFDKLSLIDMNITKNDTSVVSDKAVERFEELKKNALSVFNKDTNGELKFPFKVKISYQEKIFSKKLETKSQTSCTEVANYMDVVRTEDFPSLIPDNIIDDASKEINNSIKEIEYFQTNYLMKAIEYVNYACIGSTVSLFAFKIYRNFQELSAITACIAGESQGKTCSLGKNPVTAIDKLNKCYYTGSEDPIKKSKQDYVLGTCKTVQNPTGERKSLTSLTLTNPEFSIVQSAWNYEERLWYIMRWACDRTLCRVTPARWTEDRTIEDIRSIKSNEQKCAVDLGNVRSLRKIDSCGDNYKDLLQKSFQKQENCYKLDNCLYKLDPGNNKLILISKETKDKNNVTDCEKNLKYNKVGDSVYTSLQETCNQICGRAEGWEGKCMKKDFEKDSAYKKDTAYYSGGWTRDCATKDNQICVCYRNDTKIVSKEIKDVQKRGAAYAGIGKDEYYSGSSGADKSTLGSGWKFNYRENRLYLENNGKSGIYYPKERFYSGRDEPGALGMSHLFDMFRDEKKISELNPYVDYISPFFPQLCLTGMNARINLLKNHLKMFQKCMEQTKTTGDANSATCKKIFSQGLCNLLSTLFLSQEKGCFGKPMSASQGKDGGAPSTLALLRTAIGSATKDMENSLKADYGEEMGLASYLEGGSVSIAKNICLFALGIDINLDLEAMATVTMGSEVPSRTSVLVLTKSGQAGERQMLSFNPANGNAIYAYDAAWTISSGCDLDYNIYLSAVTDKEVRENNLDCTIVNAAIEGSNGCDNFNGNTEVTSLFYSQSGLENGQWVDKSKSVNINSNRRYDHIKIVFRPKTNVDISKCFPKEYIKGNQAVMYFPIKEQFSLADQYGCSVQSNGEFKCTAFGISGQKQAWIQDVKCFNQRTYEYEDCSRVEMHLGDPVKLAAEVYTDGNKYCLGGQLTGDEQKILPVIGAGRPETFDVKITLDDNITLQDFMSNLKNSVWVSSKVNVSAVGIEFVSAASETKSGEVKIGYQKSGSQYKFTLPKNSGINSKPFNDGEYSLTEISRYTIDYNGYKFKIKEFIPSKDKGYFVIRTSAIRASEGFGRDASLSLYYPKEGTSTCVKGQMISVTLPEGMAYPTSRTVNLKFKQTDEVIEGAQKYYDAGKKAFRKWASNYTDSKTAEFAISNFKIAATKEPQGFYDLNSQFAIITTYGLLSEKAINDKEKYKKNMCDNYFATKQKFDAGYYSKYPKRDQYEYTYDYDRIKAYFDKYGEICK